MPLRMQALDILDGKEVELPADAARRRRDAQAPAGVSQQQQQSLNRMLRPSPQFGGYYRSSYGTQGAGMQPTRYGVSGRLPRAWRDTPRAPPSGSRLVIDDSGGALSIEVPPDGLSGGTAATGAFAVTWRAAAA
jgi:hypothetical protein